MRKKERMILCVLLAQALLAFALPAQEAEPASPDGGSPADPGLGEILSDVAPLEARIGRSLRIRTEGGGDFRGLLYSVSEDRIEILDDEGRIVAIARSQLLSATEENRREGYFQDAAENRLIVMPTAFGMDRGEFHVSNTEIAAFTASYGFGPHFTLWGGVSIPGALVNAKASLPLGDSGAVAVGGFGGYAWIGEVLIGLPYAILTIGTPEKHFDIAGGVSYVHDPALGDLWSAVWALGGKKPVSRTAAVVVESWFILGPPSVGDPAILLSMLPAFVFRIASGRYSWDLGALLPFSWQSGGRGWGFIGESDVFIPFPIVSFTYRVR